MDKITLVNTLPIVFQNKKIIQSEIWNKNVEFQKNKTYLIEAESGTGKSSLLSFIFGYRNDYIGEMIFDQNNIKLFSRKQWNQLRNYNIALMWQELRLFPELTAYENVKIKNSITHHQKIDTLRKWFHILGIEDKMNTLVSKMSFGQQQRVALIRTLCQPFDFILLDEPVSHLDDFNADIMAQIVAEEAKKQNATIIVTSIGKRMNLDYDSVLKL